MNIAIRIWEGDDNPPKVGSGKGLMIKLHEHDEKTQLRMIEDLFLSAIDELYPDNAYVVEIIEHRSL